MSLIFALNANAEIKDGLFAIVGDKAITKSDIVDEIKAILILNNLSYSEERREELQSTAVKSTIKRNIKKVELSRYNFLEYSIADLNNELANMAANINLDLETLKNLCASNGLDFVSIEDQVITELLWNSLIFYLYKDRLAINKEEIDDQLKLIDKKKEIKEYLISEIIIKAENSNTIEAQVMDLKNKINEDGFEKTARSLSISKSANKGGDLGWVNENAIAKQHKEKLINTSIGEISQPVILPGGGILIFKVRDKRKMEEDIDLELAKNQLVNFEKQKILDMYSMSHYDKLRRATAVKFLQ